MVDLAQPEGPTIRPMCQGFSSRGRRTFQVSCWRQPGPGRTYLHLQARGVSSAAYSPTRFKRPRLLPWSFPQIPRRAVAGQYDETRAFVNWPGSRSFRGSPFAKIAGFDQFLEFGQDFGVMMRQMAGNARVIEQLAEVADHQH